MKYKIFTIPILCFFLISIISALNVSAEVIELTQSDYISGSIISRSNGIISLTAQSSRYTNWIDLNNYSSGTVTIDFGRNAYGSYLLSTVDDPEDLAIGYTFISDDFHTINNVSTVTIVINEGCYLYVSYSRPYTATIDTGSVPVDPTPSIVTPSPSITPTLSPTPVPENPGSNIPYHFNIPLDYYFVVIIILLGGVLICQFFKK